MASLATTPIKSNADIIALVRQAIRNDVPWSGVSAHLGALIPIQDPFLGAAHREWHRYAKTLYQTMGAERSTRRVLTQDFTFPAPAPLPRPTPEPVPAKPSLPAPEPRVSTRRSYKRSKEDKQGFSYFPGQVVATKRVREVLCGYALLLVDDRKRHALAVVLAGSRHQYQAALESPRSQFFVVESGGNTPFLAKVFADLGYTSGQKIECRLGTDDDRYDGIPTAVGIVGGPVGVWIPYPK